ncbi:hypothetical protein BdWA1_003292 [Babesia duncani]|uniref:Uncharacterized protein n=1 Tax=Babesia duncani TaxID=323732 RepID=A0AAD9PIP9_9APIC|nr:hypothetical protein BdWA1_003292 [Babesia duncani]
MSTKTVGMLYIYGILILVIALNGSMANPNRVKGVVVQPPQRRLITLNVLSKTLPPDVFKMTISYNNGIVKHIFRAPPDALFNQIIMDSYVISRKDRYKYEEVEYISKDREGIHTYGFAGGYGYELFCRKNFAGYCTLSGERYSFSSYDGKFPKQDLHLMNPDKKYYDVWDFKSPDADEVYEGRLIVTKEDVTTTALYFNGNMINDSEAKSDILIKAELTTYLPNKMLCVGNYIEGETGREIVRYHISSNGVMWRNYRTIFYMDILKYFKTITIDLNEPLPWYVILTEVMPYCSGRLKTYNLKPGFMATAFLYKKKPIFTRNDSLRVREWIVYEDGMFKNLQVKLENIYAVVMDFFF